MAPLSLPQEREPWAVVHTKKLDAVYLTLVGPKGRFAQGRLSGLAPTHRSTAGSPTTICCGSSSARWPISAAAIWPPS